MKISKILIFSFSLMTLLLISCKPNKSVTEKQLKSTVLIYYNKFQQADQITVIIHDPIHAGQEFREIRKYILTSDQKTTLASTMNTISNNRLSYNEPCPMVVPYDITVAVKSSKGVELITITANKQEITAHNVNPHPTPVELASRLHDLFCGEFQSSESDAK